MLSINNKPHTISVIIVLLSSFGIQAQNNEYLIDIGIVASNTELCKIIGWDSAPRKKLASEFTKLNDLSLKVPKLRESNTLQDAVNSYHSVAVKLVDETAIKKSALGLYLSKGNFAFLQPVVCQYMEMNSTQKSELQDYFRRMETAITTDLEKELSAEKYIDSKNVRGIIDQIISKYDKQFKDKVIELMDNNSKAKFRQLVAEADSLNYPNKYADLRRQFTMHVAQKLAKNNRFVSKQPIELPPALVVIGNLGVSGEIIPFTDQQKEILSAFMAELIDGYQEIIALYHGVESNKRDELNSAYFYFSKTLHSQSNEMDQKVEKLLGLQGKRLAQLRHQFNGPSVFIHKRLEDNQSLDITDEQARAFSNVWQNTFKGVLAKSKPGQTFEERMTQQAERLRFLQKYAYEKIFTDVQRKRWDDIAGPQLTDEQYIKMYVELEKLRKNQSK